MWKARTLWRAQTPVMALSLTLLPAGALAQGVRWESTGKVEFGGALGLIANLAGGGDAQSTYALQDGQSLVDSESTGMIYNYRDGTFTNIDHENRRYYTTSFADIAKALEARAAEARERLEEARAEAGDDAAVPEPGPDPSELNLDVKVSVDRLGDRREIAGYAAERSIVTVEIGGEATSQEEGAVLLGRLVLVSDVWTSRDFPADRLRREMLAQHPEWDGIEDLRAAGQGIREALAMDGRIKLALDEGAAKLEEIGGHPLVSRTSIVLVPPDAELDREAIFAAYDQALAPDVKGAAAGAAKEAAQNAVRNALGRFGLSGKQEEEKEGESDPTQTIVMRVTDQVTVVEEGDLPAQTFLPPPEYQERMPEWLSRSEPRVRGSR